MKLLSAIFIGFVYAVIVIIVLTISVVGLIPMLLSDLILAELLKLAASVLGQPLLTNGNAERLAAALLFIGLWISLSYGVYTEVPPPATTTDSRIRMAEMAANAAEGGS